MRNERAMREIECMKVAKPRNLILLGEEKGKLLQVAQDLAAGWLETDIDELPFHPDYKKIAAESGSIQSEQAELIRRMGAYKAQSGCGVCIVEDAETMTVELQNKLLKVLEDRGDTLAVIFISEGPLLDTIASRCMTISFGKIPLGEMYASLGCREVPVLLASEGSPELYNRIIADDWFSQYLDGLHKTLCGVKERAQFRHILRVHHALRERDNEYLPDKFQDWQLQAYLEMLSMLFWYGTLKKLNCDIPSWVRVGNLVNLYTFEELYGNYQRLEQAKAAQKKKGFFTKNDFFELLMYMIPTDEG